MPNIKTIKKYRGPKQGKVNEFLTKFVENIETCCHQYYFEHLAEREYAYYNLLANERGQYSLMSAAMHNVTPIHQSEASVIRRRDRRKTQNKNRAKSGGGRVDLWACSDGIEYFLEFKRSAASLSRVRNEVPKKINKRWESLGRQVDEIKSGIKNDENYTDFESSTYFVGMHIITLFKSSEHKERLVNDDAGDETTRIFKCLRKRFRRNPDLVLAWMLEDEKMRIIPTEWDDEDDESKWELIPFHLFCFIVEKNGPS